MKNVRMLMLFFVFLFPVFGLSEEYYTLPEIREQAKAGWHETYTDRYSRTVQVDVDVEVFGEETAPVLKVKFADYKLNGESFPEGTVWDDTNRILIYRNNPADFVFKTKAGEQPLIVHRSYGEKIALDEVYMKEYGMLITVREMIDHLNGILQEQGIWEEQYVYDQPKDFSVRCKVKKETMEVVEPAIYLAHFWQEMYGFPILTHASATFTRGDWPNFEPQMVLGMRGKDEFQITIDAMKEAEMLAQDIPLCSVQEVKSSLEKRIEEGFIRKVFDVRLGYVVYNDPNLPKDLPSQYAAESYYLMPAWVAQCIDMENPKKEFVYPEKQNDELNFDEKNVEEYKAIIVNAQTGELLNPSDRSKNGHGDAGYKGFISWESVQ